MLESFTALFGQLGKLVPGSAPAETPPAPPPPAFVEPSYIDATLSEEERQADAAHAATQPEKLRNWNEVVRLVLERRVLSMRAQARKRGGFTRVSGCRVANASLTALEQDCFRCNMCQQVTRTRCDEGACPEGVLLNCSHVFCTRCLTDHLTRAVYAFTIERRICPVLGCQIPLEPQFFEMLLPPSAVMRDERKRTFATSMFKMSCPGKGCSYVFAYSWRDWRLNYNCKCPECNVSLCLECRDVEHPGVKCHELRGQMLDRRNEDQFNLKKLYASKTAQACPTCEQEAGPPTNGHRVACACGTAFCYVCGKAWTLLHASRAFDCPVFFNKWLTDMDEANKRYRRKMARRARKNLRQKLKGKRRRRFWYMF